MLTALIVDDEYPARQELACMLEEMEGVEVAGLCEDGEEALAFLKRYSVDVVFLDIHMPAVDGLGVADQLGKLPRAPHVVFVTGYSEHAVKAFELGAADYLLKPYTQERVDQTLRKLVSLRREAGALRESEQSKELTKLPVWLNGRMVLIKIEDVLFAKADGKRSTLLYTTKGEYQTSLPLRELEEKLGRAKFFRTHKSYLVNIDKIEEIVPWFNHTYMLVLQDCRVKDIPVARHFIPAFNARMRLKEY